MNLKGVLIGLILVVIILLGIVKLMEALESKHQNRSSYIQETVNLPKKVKDLTETRKRQIKEREEQLLQE
jgi:Tfp pilus assembly protein PilV